jgi:hypothetical protein
VRCIFIMRVNKINEALHIALGLDRANCDHIIED